jgi:hypothetical protein
MCNFHVATVGEAMKLGAEAAASITEKLFQKPISLEFEKARPEGTRS